MMRTGGTSIFICQWGDCQHRLQSLSELEGHVREHIDDLSLEEGLMKESGQAQENVPHIINEGSPSGGDVVSQGTLVSTIEPPPREDPHLGSNHVSIPSRGTGNRCIVCRGEREGPGNYVVLCNGCDRPYHQTCHRPAIHGVTIKDRHSKWYCKNCASSSVTLMNSSLRNLTPSIKKTR